MLNNKREQTKHTKSRFATGIELPMEIQQQVSIEIIEQQQQQQQRIILVFFFFVNERVRNGQGNVSALTLYRPL